MTNKATRTNESGDASLFHLEQADLEDAVLRNLRKLTRAVDIYSRKLASTHHLTGPQLVCLRVLVQGSTSPSQLARSVSLSSATVTGIVGRLAARGLIAVAPSPTDRRSKVVSITDEGRSVVKAAPSPLQDHFVKRLHALPWANQVMVHVALEQIVEMMGAEDIDASPVLATGPVTALPEAVEELFDAPTPDDERPSER